MSRRLFHGFGLAIPAFLAAVCLPGPAAAGTAELQTYEVGSRDGGTVTVARIVYTADPGEANRLEVVHEPQAVTVRDLAGVVAGSGCSRTRPDDEREVRCDFSGGTLERGAASAELRVSLGDRDDTASVSGEPQPTYGGPLPDDAYLDGGLGEDRLDAGPQFGFLDGGAGDDVLTASLRAAELRGGHGNDRMMGGPEPDRFIAENTRDGRDTMSGGGQDSGGIPGNDANSYDLVSYEARRRGVRADLAGDRDDGGRGERDRIGRDVEGLAGGAGGDRLIGNGRANILTAGGGRDLLVGRAGHDHLYGAMPSGDAVPGAGADRVFAGAGDDTVAGSTGPDEIDGGAGRDHVAGNAGNDRIDLRDGALDEGGCGDGHDRIRLDQRDYFSNRYDGPCEVVRRTRPPVAVFIGRSLLAYGDEPAATAVIGCPGDAPAACDGEAEVVVDGRSGGPATLSIEPSEFQQARVPLDTESWERVQRREAVTGQLVLRVRQPDGAVVRLEYRVKIE